MSADASSPVKSLLEKPLSLLTEDDISQITREECRRFLKDRGMRRPSWNKSQAIQQVISLKALLEDRSDSDDLRRKSRGSPPLSPLADPHDSLSSPFKDAIGNADLRSVQKLGKDLTPYRRKDPIPLPLPAGVGGVPLFPAMEKAQQPRAIADVPLGQLTIFYGGKVNVYDHVPTEKAQEILHLASIPDAYDDGSTVARLLTGRPFLSRICPAYTGPSWAGLSTGTEPCISSPTGNAQQSFVDCIEQETSSQEPLPECPTSRKASLKRYLEKRKDRYKGRRAIEGSSSLNMELIFLSQKISGHLQNELPTMSIGSSGLQLRAPCPSLSRCTSIEAKKLGISVDHNDDGTDSI